MLFPTVAARVARPVLFALTLALAATYSACGASGGTSSNLPAGKPTKAPPGNVVLYVAMAQGNRIEAYRLGTDGLLPSKPFDTIFVNNPRRLALGNGVLYASVADSIISMTLGAGGELPELPTSRTQTRNDYNPIDIAVGNGFVYVAASGIGVVQSYKIKDNGDLPFLPDGTGKAENPSDFSSLELAGDYLYTGSRDTNYIDLFILDSEGNVPLAAEPQLPRDSVSLPDDIVVRNHVLYITSGSDKSVHAYIIKPDGFLPGDQDSRTKTEEYYSNIMLDGNTLYAAAYNEGRIDLYTVDADGMLPENPPFFKTQFDPASYPSRMVMLDGILYVAQAGLNRVDAYVLGGNGLPPTYPTSSTKPVQNVLGFPLDLVFYQLP